MHQLLDSKVRKHQKSDDNEKNYQKIKELAEISYKCYYSCLAKTRKYAIRLDNGAKEVELAVSVDDIIDEAVSIDAEFKDGDEKKRTNWVYKFMARKHLAVRTTNPVSQNAAAAKVPVR